MSKFIQRPDRSFDPLFNSNADYNVLFREASREASQAQFHAFTDSWSWVAAAELYNQFIDTCPNLAVAEMMEAFHSFLKNSPMMAYLAMMAPRLVELHRVLKLTGSLYLHCDPTATSAQILPPREVAPLLRTLDFGPWTLDFGIWACNKRTSRTMLKTNAADNEQFTHKSTGEFQARDKRLAVVESQLSDADMSPSNKSVFSILTMLVVAPLVAVTTLVCLHPGRWGGAQSFLAIPVMAVFAVLTTPVWATYIPTLIVVPIAMRRIAGSQCFAAVRLP
jgi:hypothetical protein